MDNKEEKPKTEKKGKYVVNDGEGNIISQNMPKEFEDMIDLIFQEAKGPYHWRDFGGTWSFVYGA